MPGSANKVKLGELLVDAGIITSGDLTEAIQVSRRLGVVPIGQVLCRSKCVTEDNLEAALEVQSLVKNGTINRAAAVDALRRSHEHGLPLNQVLELSVMQEDNQQTSKRLAELLLDSDIVSQDQLDHALNTSFSSGMPLGSALVLEGVLSPSLFPSILRIQRNIKDGTVDREQGIDEIKSTFLHWMKAEESLARSGEEAANPAEQVREREQEIEFLEPPPGREQFAVDTRPEAGSAPRLIDLLKNAGAFSQHDLQRSFDRVMEDPHASAQLFLLLGLVDEETIKTAQRSHTLREKQLVTDEEAVSAIRAKTSGEGDNEDSRTKRYYDKRWRKSTTKVLGGIALGAAVAGLSFLNKKKR